MGWFHSTPKPEKPTKEKLISRAEKIKLNGGEPLMPSIHAEYIVGYWQDLGLCGAGSMGATALSALEISAWASMSGVELEPWEFTALKQMSQNYVQYLYQGENPDTPPPYGETVKEFDRGVVQKKLVGAFKAFIMAGKK